MSLRYVRGVRLKSWLLNGLFGIGSVCGLVALTQLVLMLVRGTSADLGWWLLAVVLLALGVWGRSIGVLVQLLADDDSRANRARHLMVWLLVAAMVLLITGLKLISPDLDAYKRLVFGEGGLVEWGQVLILVAAIRVSWLIGDDLKKTEANHGFVESATHSLGDGRLRAPSDGRQNAWCLAVPYGLGDLLVQVRDARDVPLAKRRHTDHECIVVLMLHRKAIPR